MSASDSLHYILCRKAATFLRNYMNSEDTRQMRSCPEDNGLYSNWKWAAVELVTNGMENCDVWATNGSESVVVEVKTSRTDFLRDRKKWHRQKDYEYYQAGNFRYYLAPEGVITEADLPEGWGLLLWNGTKITKAKQAAFRKVSNHADLIVMCSIMRREGIRPKTFDYRYVNTMDSYDKIGNLPEGLEPYRKALHVLYRHVYGKDNVPLGEDIAKEHEEGKLCIVKSAGGTELSWTDGANVIAVDVKSLRARKVGLAASKRQD